MIRLVFSLFTVITTSFSTFIMILGIIGEVASNVTLEQNVIAKADNGGYSFTNLAQYFDVKNDVIKCQNNLNVRR